jgi:hypothetical protein
MIVLRRHSSVVAMVAVVCLGMLAYMGCGGDQQTASTQPETAAAPAPAQQPAAPKPPSNYSADPNSFGFQGSGDGGMTPFGSSQGPANQQPSAETPAQPAPTDLAGGGTAPAPGAAAPRTGDNRPKVDMNEPLPPKQDPPKTDVTPGPVPQAGFEVGDLAPEILGEDVDGTEFKLSDYRGKVVVLDFWGDW